MLSKDVAGFVEFRDNLLKISISDFNFLIRFIIIFEFVLEYKRYLIELLEIFNILPLLLYEL